MSNDDVTEWLAAAPKGVRWDKAQEMYALYQERRKAQAMKVARRLMGTSEPERMHCPSCFGAFPVFCKTCLGEGEVDAE